MTNQQLAETCRDILAEADKQALIAFLEDKIVSLRFAVKQNAFEKIRPELKYELACAEVALAALTQTASPALKLPDGWVVAPREPTDKMWAAGCQALKDHDTAKATYQAMLDAAPTAPHTAHIEPSCNTGRKMPRSEFNELVGKLAARNYGTSVDIADVLCAFNIKPERPE